MSDGDLEALLRRLTDEIEAKYLCLFIEQLRTHAPRFRGVDGEAAINKFADAFTNTLKRVGRSQ